MTKWTKQDSTAAAAQGWGVFEIWDTDRLQLEIQRDNDSGIFTTDEAAREFVKMKSHTDHSPDSLWARAVIAVFHSKLSPKPKRKKK